MEIRQLEYFVAVAEEANFTRAAARVHVAQPGVSAQIRQLERELGAELVDRSARKVRLTAVGEAVLPYARAVLSGAAGARHAVEELTGMLRGRVAVGMVTACAALNFFDVLASFHERYPAIQITLSEANSDELLARLLDGQLDLAWVGTGGPLPPGVESAVLVDDPLVLALPQEHRLAGKRAVAVAELRELELVCLPRGTGIRQALDAACAAAGFQPRVALEASSPAVVAQLAVRGLGLAVLAASIVGEGSELCAVPIERPEVRSRIELAWPVDRPTTPAARALVAHAHGAM